MTTGRINQVTRQSIANGELPGTDRGPARRDPSQIDRANNVRSRRFEKRQPTNKLPPSVLLTGSLPTGESRARRAETTRATASVGQI